MPFKTRKEKSRAGEKWSKFDTSAKFVYGGGISESSEPQSRSEKTEKPDRDVLEVKYVSSELARIAILALSIIGLQLLLKFSHIGI